ncbi:MAG: VWA domain-containing protein, partial [Bryobacteraceae bacterium]
MLKRSLALLLTIVAAGQPPQKEEPMLTFKSASTLVVVNVSVRDRSGKPVEGMKQQDFTVTEDGKPQSVSVFEFQKLTSETLPPMAAPTLTPRGAAPAQGAVATERQKAIIPSKPGEIRYRDRRLMVLLFDFSSMPQPDQIR